MLEKFMQTLQQIMPDLTACVGCLNTSRGELPLTFCCTTPHQDNSKLKKQQTCNSVKAWVEYMVPCSSKCIKILFTATTSMLAQHLPLSFYQQDQISQCKQQSQGCETQAVLHWAPPRPPISICGVHLTTSSQENQTTGVAAWVIYSRTKITSQRSGGHSATLINSNLL